MQSRCSINVVILLLRSGGGGVEKSRLKLTSAKVEVEVEAELGNISFIHWVDVPINYRKSFMCNSTYFGSRSLSQVKLLTIFCHTAV